MVLEPKINTYFAKSAAFAQPILQHFRALVHQACPEVEERIKWGMPHFDYKGEMMCSIAAFKQHCAIGFWKASLMKDAALFKEGNEEAMGSLGQIKSLSDLPPDEVLIAYIQEAMQLNDSGVKLPAKTLSKDKKDLVIAADVQDALLANAAASHHFEAFTYGKKKEYIAWFDEAKAAPTREKRIATAMEWIAEGKGRNWKYER